MDKTDQVLTKKVEEILPNKESLKKILESKKIRVYLGIDPTGTKLHLGHTIPLKKLQEFADLGHEAILVFGTGTVLAGDPSQRSSAREKIMQSEIDKNIKTWKDQASKIIDLGKVQIKQNGDWLLKLRLAEILNIASNISAIQLFKRDMFQGRVNRDDTVWMHEIFYPILQGYDSVFLDVDLEIGGTDQTFNMLIGRELQKKMNNREKFVLTTPLINGIDGKPMSKSSGNCIWIDDEPNEMYGKIMSITDSQIEEYWSNLTDSNSTALKKLKSMDAKKRLAHELVRIYHGEKNAQNAQDEFKKVVQKKQVPDFRPTLVRMSGASIAQTIIDNNIVSSISEAKNLAKQGGMSISYDQQPFEKVIDPKIVPTTGNFTLKIGTVGYYNVEEEKQK